MNNIKLKVGDKSYSPKMPKAKIWRQAIMFRQKYGDEVDIMTSEAAFDDALDLMAGMFNHEAITVDVLEAEVDADELMATFYALQGWLMTSVTAKMKELPGKNAQVTAPD